MIKVNSKILCPINLHPINEKWNQRTNGPVNAHLIYGISTEDKMAEQTLTLITIQLIEKQ